MCLYYNHITFWLMKKVNLKLIFIFTEKTKRQKDMIHQLQKCFIRRLGFNFRVQRKSHTV